uniref:MucB/RseB family protein n=1 Tax=uncultured marine bacterium 580 TaxID=257400 RepID=Q6SFI4_9BACT|nr:MucB/RseB family protein [uncultured marine bacterium 580]
MTLLKKLLTLLCLVFPLLSFAMEDPWSILEKSAKASQQLNYEGVFHSQSSSESNSTHVIHANIDNKEYCLLKMLDGAPNEVFCSGDMVYVTSQDGLLIKKRKNQFLFPSVLPSDIKHLKKNYQLSFGEKKRVADRMAQHIELKAKDNLRFNYHIWIDEKNLLPLKLIVTNNKNQPIEQSTFTTIAFSEVIDKDIFEKNINLSKIYVSKNKFIENYVSNKFWNLKDLPSGFKEVDLISRRVNGLNLLDYQIIFSDGLAYVSLFIRPITRGTEPKEGTVAIGPTNISARYQDGYQIMSVGMVPPETVNTFSGAIEF